MCELGLLETFDLEPVKIAGDRFPQTVAPVQLEPARREQREAVIGGGSVGPRLPPLGFTLAREKRHESLAVDHLRSWQTREFEQSRKEIVQAHPRELRALAALQAEPRRAAREGC